MRVFVLLLIITTSACYTQECLSDPMAHVRDPKTGACIVVSNSDGCNFCVSENEHCVVADVDKLDYSSCGACPAAAETASQADCLAADRCRAVYKDGSFFACWTTAPSGPIHTGVCVGLDAHECSRHDNCASWFAAGADGVTMFDHCAEELPVSVMAFGM